MNLRFNGAFELIILVIFIFFSLKSESAPLGFEKISELLLTQTRPPTRSSALLTIFHPCFLTLLIPSAAVGQSYKSFAQWKDLLTVLLSSDDALHNPRLATDLFAPFVGCLYALFVFFV